MLLTKLHCTGSTLSLVFILLVQRVRSRDYVEASDGQNGSGAGFNIVHQKQFLVVNNEVSNGFKDPLENAERT